MTSGFPSFRELGDRRGLLVGASFARYQWDECVSLRALIERHASLVVPGLELKWKAVQPGPGHFNFADADSMMRHAAMARQAVRGVHLIWHEALPVWFADEAGDQAGMRRQVELHIAALTQRYAGRMQSWDVVNEPVEPYDGRADGLRMTPFLRTLGEDYIDLAFHEAARHDPAAKLVLNEYGLEMASEVHARRREAVFALLRRLLGRGVPVHALGIQAHLTAREAPFDPTVFRRFVDEVASLGLDIYLTEMDVADRLLPAEQEARDRSVADAYGAFLRTALAAKAVRMLVFWGLTDRYSWMNDSIWARRPDGLPVRAHPFDFALCPKSASEAIADALATVTAI